VHGHGSDHWHAHLFKDARKKEMAMKAGAILREVTLKDGTVAVLRRPRWEDVDKLLEFITALTNEEYVEIAVEKPPTREQEMDWLAQRLKALEKGEETACVAEVDGRIVGNSGLHRGRGVQSHVGVFGLAIHRDFRDQGLGTAMLETVLEEARDMGLRLVKLMAFATNARALHVYQKAGFREVGRIPQAIFKYGRYFDEVVMVFELAQEEGNEKGKGG